MKLNYCEKKSSNNNLKEIVKFLKVVSEENRLRIICILWTEQKCVCEIWQYLNLPQNLVSHHLKILSDFGLIFPQKKGLKVFYKLNQKVVKKYIESLNKFLNPKKKINL